jgi:G3E family GTPase
LDVGYSQSADYQSLLQLKTQPDHESHDHGSHRHHAHQHEHDHDHPHEHHHHHSSHLDNDGFMAISFESDRPFNVQRFEAFLQESLPQEVFRAKGILWFTANNLRNIFQLSGPRFGLRAEEWRTPPKNQLVLIGRHLDEDQLRQQLTDCLV